MSEPPPKTESTMSSESSSGQLSSDEAKHFKKIFHESKVDGGTKSAWAMTLETMGMHHGKDKRGDVMHESFEEAMAAIRTTVQEKQWDFALTPFSDFDATLDDLLHAFVVWAKVKRDDKNNKNGNRKVQYNISKSFRRMEAYVAWMEKNCKDLELSGETMKSVADAWKIRMTRDKEGRLVWWNDFATVDLHVVKHDVPHDDTLRYFVWISHYVMFDKKTQEKGMIMVEAIGNIGLVQSMTIVPMDLGTKLDRLTIGTLPLRFEGIYMYNNPTWVRIIMALMMPFMGGKMRKRMHMIKKDKAPRAVIEEMLGKECIPTGIAQLEGTIEQDMIIAKIIQLGGGE